MGNQNSEEIFFAYCALPSVSAYDRRVQHFRMPLSGKLFDDEGNEFVIVPFATSEYNMSQQATTQDEYYATASIALELLKSKKLKKLVLSRLIHEDRREGNLYLLFECLLKMYPTAFVYYLNHPEFGVWIGATPELLLEGRSGSYRTVALAGTRTVDDHSGWNEKLKEEQQLVTDFIDEQLQAIGINQVTASDVQSVIAGPLVHLKTEFTFTSQLSAAEVSKVLNPTSAVCGMPRVEAFQFIQINEKHQRKLYTGYLGIQRKTGDVDYYVNLRCMQVFHDHYEIFVGGGFTSSSKMEEEWLETEHKSSVMLNAISTLK